MEWRHGHEWNGAMAMNGMRHGHEWNRAMAISGAIHGGHAWGPYMRAILVAYSKFRYSHEPKIFLGAR